MRSSTSVAHLLHNSICCESGYGILHTLEQKEFLLFAILNNYSHHPLTSTRAQLKFSHFPLFSINITL